MGGAREQQLGPTFTLAPIVEAAVTHGQVLSARLPCQYIPHHRRLPHNAAFLQSHSIVSSVKKSCNNSRELHFYGFEWHLSKRQAWNGAPSLSRPQTVQCVHKLMAREGDCEGRKEEPGHLFCFGFGYTTLGLANTLKKEGW